MSVVYKITSRITGRVIYQSFRITGSSNVFDCEEIKVFTGETK